MAEPFDDLPRSLLGYNREEVEARLEAERERLGRAESEAERLGAKLDDRDRRLKQALEELDKARREAAEKGRAASRLDALRQSPNFAGAEPEAHEEGGIARAIEEVYAEMWRGFGRIGERAAESGGRLVARALLASRLVDPEAGVGRKPRPEAPAAMIPDPPPATGGVEIDVGPLRDFAQLTAFEDAVKGIEGAGPVNVKKFSGGRATIAVELEGSVDLAAELGRAVPASFTVREAGEGRFVLDVAEDDQAAA